MGKVIPLKLRETDTEAFKARQKKREEENSKIFTCEICNVDYTELLKFMKGWEKMKNDQLNIDFNIPIKEENNCGKGRKIMKRIIEINICFECPFHFTRQDFITKTITHHCVKSLGEKIDDLHQIPDWCRLEVASDYNNSANGL